MKIWARMVAMLLGALILFAVHVDGSSAYGTDHLYQVTLSYNCMNSTLCAPTPFGIGGIWGWIEPDGTKGATAGSDVDGQVQFQGHSNANPALNGAGHSTGFEGWQTFDCPSSPLCALVAAEGVPPDPSGKYFAFFTDFGGLGTLPVVTPATPGNYSAHPAPGIASTAHITLMH